MVRVRNRKRNKQAKANKLAWHARRAATAATAALKLFDDVDVPLPPSVPKSHNRPLAKRDIAVVRETSQKGVRHSLRQKQGSATNPDDEGPNIGDFIKNIPNWGTEKYQAPQFIKRKHKLSQSGALERDEKESNNVKTDENINSLNEDVKVEPVPEPHLLVEENRTVGLKYILNDVLKLQCDHCKLCPMGQLNVESENREIMGLSSKIVLACGQCLQKYEVLIDGPDSNVD